ncbi:lysozyme [Rhizobium sp. NTR19]|uniref:Lysozyme n=1 Tax=Neorhizobium turbinariae TaxID=2937795 RepID=A0ABT0IML9_9HYPH|nr:lysozyme [Neorhizobium turbinariae]MCK8779098.1 lysozyme [Neorhizobium turbinariae]
MTRRINAAGLSLVKEFEGFEPRWYKDPVGIWTIGYGHTDAAGDPKYAATKGLVLTEAKATEILQNDLQKYADAVSKAVTVPLNDNQFDALVSWCYNVGPGAMASSTLVRKLNAGDYAAVPFELSKWNKAGGKVLRGLTRRRAAEGSLFTRKASPAPAPVPTPKPAPAPPVGESKPTASNATKGLVAAIVAAVAAAGAWFSDFFQGWF